MKRTIVVSLILFAAATFAPAQIARPTTDVLGAHLNYGRGCTACHSPHSGAAGNGAAKSPTAMSTGMTPLWGEDASSLYGKTITTGGGKFVEVLPASMSAGTPDVAGMLTCLGCHDGNYAPRAMMKNRIYETLPSTYARANAVPTLMGSSGATNSYINDHPMGLNAHISCGGAQWDCAVSNGVVRMNGAKSRQFVSNYGFFVKPGSYNNNAVIVCTTCHDPHSMNVVNVSSASSSGLPAGSYTTMFFLRAPYNPNNTNPLSNQTAQFCRQCHADKSNEMNGSSAKTIF
jgi:formate-dependent nitrite reductase cytochrome c552 subunit